MDVLALQTKLHAVEDARAKEMQRHGELLDAVQRQLDGSRRNEKELLAMVAKLRADKCQHDAEMAALRAKTKQTEDSAQASDQRQRLVNEDWRERIDGKDRAIAELKATVERLQGAVADGAVQQSVSRTQVEGLERDNQRLHAEHAELEKRDELLIEEKARLALLVSCKESEAAQASTKINELQDQVQKLLERAHAGESQIRDLETQCDRMRVMRNRVVAWKRRHFDSLSHCLHSQSLFLTWKSLVVASKAQACREKTVRLEQRCAKLEKQVATTKISLSTTREWLKSQRDDAKAWQELFGVNFVAQVMPRLREREKQLQDAFMLKEAQIQQRLQMIEEGHRVWQEKTSQEQQQLRQRSKRRVNALCAAIQRQEHLYLRAMVFQGWKDVYMRSMVAQTTHAVMIARAARVLGTTGSLTSSSSSRQKSVTDLAAIAPLRAERAECPAGRRGSNASIYDPEAEEAQWKRWRRLSAEPVRPKSSEWRDPNVSDKPSSSGQRI